MLDRGAGSWRVGPYGVYVPAGRRYIPGTNLIETTWMTPQGWLRVVDGLTIGEWHDNKQGSSHTRPPTDFDADHLLVRVIECIQGEVQVEMVCEPMLDYGATPAQWSVVDTGERGRLRARRERRRGPTLRLFSDMRMGIEGNRAHARHTMREGERRFCALSWTEELRRPAHRRAGDEHLERTEPLLALVAGRRHLPRPPLALLTSQRSALVLKGLTFMPTGALVAAPTTSLPETPRGRAQLGLPLLLDARRVVHAVGRCTRSAWTGRPTTSSSTSPTWSATRTARCRSCTGSAGERDLAESTLEHLKGYEGARPVRIGNGAYNQRQNDVFGAVLDSVYLHSKRRDHIPERLWPVLIDQVAVRGEGLEGARPGHLGGARRAAPLRLLEADVLGGDGSRRAPGRTARRATSTPSAGRRWPTRSARTSSPAASTSAACFASTTTPTRSTPPRCWSRSCASCRPTTSACARP